MNKRVLFIANFTPKIGGISGQIELLANHLSEMGIPNQIFNTKGGPLKRIFLPISLFVKAKNWHVFHIHGCSNWGFLPIILGVIIGRLTRKKIVVTYHGGSAEQFFTKCQWLIKPVLINAHEIIVLSDYLEQVFRKFGLKTTIIPNIIPDKRQHVVKTVFHPNIITTRSLNPIYDILTAIKAFALLVERYPEASLNVVGAGSCENDLKIYVRDHKIPNVRFRGRVSNDQIYEELSKADIWCNPTTVDNMPVSLLEAINAGLVVVTTNAGGITAMVDECSAYLTNIGDYQAMASAFFEIVERPDRAAKVQNNAQKVLSYYFWESNKDKLIKIYNA
jgi:glycosyltransferase involved in cell wall biosynthesis